MPAAELDVGQLAGARVLELTWCRCEGKQVNWVGKVLKGNHRLSITYEKAVYHRYEWKELTNVVAVNFL